MADSSQNLEVRAERFAAAVRAFCRGWKRDALTGDDVKQLLRASGSVGANCLEANEGIDQQEGHRIEILHLPQGSQGIGVLASPVGLLLAATHWGNCGSCMGKRWNCAGFFPRL